MTIEELRALEATNRHDCTLSPQGEWLGLCNDCTSARHAMLRIFPVLLDFVEAAGQSSNIRSVGTHYLAMQKALAQLE